MQYFDAGRAARRPAHRRRPAAHRHRRAAPTCTCSRCPAPTWRWPTACCTSRSGEGLVDEALHRRRAPPASTRCARGGRAPTGRTGSSGSPASPVADLRRDRRALLGRGADGDDPHRPRRRAAQQRHRHRPGLHQPGARPGPARPAVLRLRHDHRAGQRAGRPRARAEGRPAARLPARSTTRPPARTSPRSGASTPTSCRGPGSRRTSCSTGWAPTAASGRCWCWRRTSRSSAPRRQPGRRAAARRSTSWWSPTSSCPRPPQLADVVLPTAQWAEEDGTMTNLEGRVHPPPAGARRRRRACATDLQMLARARRPARAGAQFFTDRPAGRSSTSCAGPAPAGSPTTPASPTSGSTPSEGVFWPCPTEDHPGTPRLFADAFATADGRARFLAVEHRDAAELPDADYPYVLTTGRVHGAVPVAAPRPGAARRSPWPRPSPYVELHPDLARAARHRRRRPGRAAHPPRRGAVLRRPRSTDGIRPRHRLRAVPLGRRGGANALTNPALDPTRGCRSSRSARSALDDGRTDADGRSGAARSARRHRPHPSRTDRPTRRHRCTAHPASCRASSRSRGRGWTSPPRSTRR